MKKPAAVLVVVSLGLLVATARTGAHHSFALFDMNKNVTYDGSVAEYRWINPHTHIIMRVPSTAKDSSTVGTWDVEGGSTNIMTRQGWNRATFKAGDAIIVVGHPMKDGSKGVSLFYVVLPNGKRLYHDIARPKESSE